MDRRLGVVLASLVLGAPLAACDDLKDYSTGPGEVYRGAVVGSAPQVVQDDAGADAGQKAADRGHDGAVGTTTAGAATEVFLLYGFATGTLLDLTFDADAVTQAKPGPVGTLETYTCSVVQMAQCASEDRVQGPLVDMELYVIPGLSQDVLSRYDFPGGNRLRNFIVHGVTPGPSGRSAMVFVSLMEKGGIELRVMAPEGPAVDGASAPQLFGVFRLKRAKL